MSLRTYWRIFIVIIGIASLPILIKNVAKLKRWRNRIQHANNGESYEVGTYESGNIDGGLQKKYLSPEIQKEVKTLLMFIGYPRSGHTLVGSLLDAHPHIMVANEFNMLLRWQNWTVEQRNARNLINGLYENSRKQAISGFRSSSKSKGRSYFVPHQWQGKFKDFIKVIGDKKGGRSTRHLADNEDILKDISSTVRLPIKMVHVVRNPFDNIATIVLRDLKVKTSREKLARNPVNNTKLLSAFTAYYHGLTVVNSRLISAYGTSVITLHSEDIIDNPRKALKKLCHFLEVTCSEDYLEACVKIIYRKPSKSRRTVFWPHDIKETILQRIAKIPFLQRYSFDT